MSCRRRGGRCPSPRSLSLRPQRAVENAVGHVAHPRAFTHRSALDERERIGLAETRLVDQHALRPVDDLARLELLAERIDLATPSRPKRDGVHKVFSELKDELNSFAALLNQPHGLEDLSQHDLLWLDLQLRTELSSASIDSLVFK